MDFGHEDEGGFKMKTRGGTTLYYANRLLAKLDLNNEEKKNPTNEGKEQI